MQPDHSRQHAVIFEESPDDVPEGKDAKAEASVMMNIIYSIY